MLLMILTKTVPTYISTGMITISTKKDGNIENNDNRYNNDSTDKNDINDTNIENKNKTILIVGTIIILMISVRMMKGKYIPINDYNNFNINNK